VRSKHDTETKLDEGDSSEPAKRHIFGVRRRGDWIVGGEVPAGSIATAICGAIAMAHGEIRGGMNPPPDPCLACVKIRDEIILKGMGVE
jgi:hypothetical protein